MAPLLKYHNGTAWTEVSTAGAPGPTGPTGPAGPVASVIGLVQKTGDTMTGPLVVPVPTLITQVGRWAEGTPRFTDVAARDAAYATLPGGVAKGMRCYVASLKCDLFYDGTTWKGLSTYSGCVRGLVKWGGTKTLPSVSPYWNPPWNDLTFVTNLPMRSLGQTAGGLTLPADYFSNGWIVKVLVSGTYSAAMTVVCGLMSDNVTYEVTSKDTRFVNFQYGDQVEFIFLAPNWNGALTVDLYSNGAFTCTGVQLRAQSI